MQPCDHSDWHIPEQGGVSKNTYKWDQAGWSLEFGKMVQVLALKCLPLSTCICWYVNPQVTPQSNKATHVNRSYEYVCD